MGSDDLIGQVLHDTYRIDELIGRGGSGEVYAASHLRIERRFAVKVLLPGGVTDQDAVARFEREARVTSAIGNPHIVEVVDCYRTEDGRPYLVMELLEGEDLAAYCQRRGRLEPFEAGAILQQAANGLEAAHLQGVIHRDLKPQNLFLCSADRGHRLVKLLDFGTSKILGDPREKSAHALLGTPHYMAPEQAASRSGAITARTDVYALGVILFEVLSGERPFKAAALFSLLYEIVKHDPPSLKQLRPDLPDELCRVVAKAMRKDPGQRHASVAALSRHFSAAAMRGDEAEQEQTYNWDAFYELATRVGGVNEGQPGRARRQPSDEVTQRAPAPAPAPARDRGGRDTEQTEPRAAAARPAVHMLTGTAAPQGPTRVVRQAMVHPLVAPPAGESAPDLSDEAEDTDSITDPDTDTDRPSISSGIIDRVTPPKRTAFDALTPPLEVLDSGESAVGTNPHPSVSISTTQPPLPGGDDDSALHALPPPGDTGSAVGAGFGSLAAPGETGSSVSGVFGEHSVSGVDVEAEATIAWDGRPEPRPLPEVKLTPAPTEVVEPAPAEDEGLPRYVGPLIALALAAALILFAAALWAVCGMPGG